MTYKIGLTVKFFSILKITIIFVINMETQVGFMAAFPDYTDFYLFDYTDFYLFDDIWV